MKGFKSTILSVRSGRGGGGGGGGEHYRLIWPLRECAAGQVWVLTSLS